LVPIGFPIADPTFVVDDGRALIDRKSLSDFAFIGGGSSGSTQT
jgi:hypothetical protein